MLGFEKVICTDLLLWDHKNSLTVEKSGFISQGIKGKIDGTNKTFWGIYGIWAIRVRASRSSTVYISPVDIF